MPGPQTAELTQEATQALAAFVAGLNYQDLPERVREHTKNVLLDTLACAVAGHQGEETHQVAALAVGARAIPRSSVIGGDRLSLAGATLLNGYLITAVTMCDIHRATLTHVTPEVVPPALAIAERDGLTGRDLLVALAAGFETTTRIGVGADYPAIRANAAGTAPACSARSAPPPRSAGCAASTPRPWRGPSVSRAARRPARSRRGARRR